MNDTDTFISELRRSELYLSNEKVKAAVDAAIPRIKASPDKGSLVQEIDTLRSDIEAVLSGKTRNLEKNDEEWIKDIVDREYGEASTTLSLVLDPRKGERAPSKEKIKASILKQLKPEQIAELRKLRESVLLIVPDTNIERLQTAINKPECKNKGAITGQQDAYVGDFFKDTVMQAAQHFGVRRDQEITKYRFAIVEGAQNFNGTDASEPWNKQQSMRNDKRIADFEANYASKGIQSMNAHAYMMLMMRNLRVGKPTDMINASSSQFTLLAGEPKAAHVRDGSVAFGYGAGARAGFDRDGLGNPSAGARLRASVMGEVEA
ncbi:MAG: hypothetical protein AAB383_03830 [Patescibacteria group bacterium]